MKRSNLTLSGIYGHAPMLAGDPVSMSFAGRRK
jgi:hypothetical protein